MTITTSPLPAVVKAYTPASVSWSVEAPGETTFTPIGSTSHRIYVTLGTPSGDVPPNEPTNRRLNFVCYAAAGLGSQDAIATAIWDELENEPPVFDLEFGGCPAPCPWGLMVPGNPGQCIHLAILMEHACEIIGVPASIGYVYATTDYDNFSTSANAFETREYEYEPGQTRTEELVFFASGGLNNWEAVCVVNNHYYAVQETHSAISVQVLKDIVCPNDPPDENYQCWAYCVGPPVNACFCNTVDQYPAPVPGGCP